MLKPILSFLHDEGHTVITYFDDALIQGDNFNLCAVSVNCTAEVLDKLGFTIHPVRSVFTLSKSIKFLGFTFNSEETSATLTDAKMEEFQKMCQEAVCLQEIQIQRLAELIGHLIAALPGVRFGTVLKG